MNPTTLVDLAKAAHYNEENKKQFKRAVVKWLKDIAKRLELPEDSFDIRYNEGGIAVSGEGTLHTESFYLQVGESGVFWRTCKSRKDFTGGSNRWVQGFGESCSTQEVVNQLVRALLLSSR